MIDIAIIGGGPAGLCAGLYAARGGANALLFEELFVGGQATRTMRIENYPGFPEGVEGSELGMRMEKQASRFGLQTRFGTVEALSLSGPVKRIRTGEEEVKARTVILATGAQPRKLGLPREDALEGMGISYCATCDGAFFKGREVAVAGGGDTALSEALYLARFAAKVYLVHRRDALRGCAALQKAVFAEPKIELVWNHVVTGLEGAQKLEGIYLQNTQTGDMMERTLSALFVAVGVTPSTALVQGQLELAANGHIPTDQRMRTAIDGVYAVGDVRDTPLRQVVSAAADGAVAATMALEYIAAGI